jgi:hypothetical protein
VVISRKQLTIQNPTPDHIGGSQEEIWARCLLFGVICREEMVAGKFT